MTIVNHGHDCLSSDEEDEEDEEDEDEDDEDDEDYEEVKSYLVIKVIL